MLVLTFQPDRIVVSNNMTHVRLRIGIDFSVTRFALLHLLVNINGCKYSVDCTTKG